MLNKAKNTDLYCQYYAQRIRVYKDGAIRKVTMDKYLMTQAWREKLIPDCKIGTTFPLPKTTALLC